MSTKIEYNGSIVATVEGGNTATLPVKDKEMATDILVTVPEVVLQEKTATANGEVVADEGYDGLSKVMVNVETTDTSDATVTADKVLNGETFYGADGKDTGTMPNYSYGLGDFVQTLDVDTPEYTLNGAYGGTVQIDLEEMEVTENGTYEATSGKVISKVTVAVEGEGGGDVEFKIVVTVDSGATVTATKGSIKVSGISVNGTCTLIVPEEGTWTVTATIDGVSATSQTVVVKSAYDTVFEYETATLTIAANAGAVVTCSQGDISHTKTIVDAPVTFTLYSFGVWNISVTYNGSTKTDTISVLAGNSYSKDMSSGAPAALNLTSWEKISEVSADGTGANYWAVGDTKAITLSGTVGTLALSGTYYVYILGFNHNSVLEGNGITFGAFKTEGGKNIALCDSKYDLSGIDNTFAMNFYTVTNYGGWKASDLRYGILGSTNIKPSSYGGGKTEDVVPSVVGYDATETCATNPVSKTLMAALPTDLRAVMKPMTIYTTVPRNGALNTEASVEASIDYLPLLSEFEATGVIKKANSYEANKQAQYAYYEAGNTKQKYNHSNTSEVIKWWLRSSDASAVFAFCYGSDTSESTWIGDSNKSYGIAPIFRV